MNIKASKKPDTRIDVRYLSSLGIKAYDTDNLYPQNIRDITAASPTGLTCLNRYARFIEGNGLSSTDFSALVVNRSGERMDDIHQLLSKDLALFAGFALHVNYNILGEITELNYVPFENCRLEEEDDMGVVANIILHPDWRGKKTRSGKAIKVNTENIDILPVFNPRKEIVQAQIEKAGGIECYKGQILWVSADGKNTYPRATYDAAISDMSTDEGISNVMNRNTRNNFLISGMLVTRKGQQAPAEEESDDPGFSNVLDDFQGDTRSCNLLEVMVEHDEEIPQFVPFRVNNFDKDFTVTAESAAERIYAAFNQEVFYCIRIGKLGFSGDVISDAYSYYAGQVTQEQRMLSRAYQNVFKHWFESLPNSDNYSIEPLTFMPYEASN